MNYHRSIPSLSSSIASSEPRTSSSSSTNNYYSYQNFNPQALSYSTSLRSNRVVTPVEQKRYSEPLKRWDDSQLEIELAEDDLIVNKKKNSSLRFIDKFRHHRQQDHDRKNSIARSFKKVYDWLF
ncbi:hypothetical protein INT47_005827 [Mucor saturninus]|uniref:Uncharacterized protein n=1 Tax=Mucor saturninus TaxID=64648 RepID=A0A8H7R005_9FUNG|nr:hypothetical protein INT47_005827 [Mucor saturninus]